MVWMWSVNLSAPWSSSDDTHCSNWFLLSAVVFGPKRSKAASTMLSSSRATTELAFFISTGGGGGSSWSGSAVVPGVGMESEVALTEDF